MLSSDKGIFANMVKKGFLASILLGFCLIILGWVLVRTTNFLSIAGACAILSMYSLMGYVGFPRIQNDILSLASIFGLLAGVIFTSEILLEYVILPNDNTSWGIIEFSGIFALYFLSGLFVSYQHGSTKYGILAAIVSAMLSSMMWFIVTLVIFYIFRGTARQEFVFRAEGSFEDFARSGMKDFNAFIMEDFFGAGFFHLLLSPVLASILGAIGGLFGKGIARYGKH